MIEIQKDTKRKSNSAGHSWEAEWDAMFRNPLSGFIHVPEDEKLWVETENRKRSVGNVKKILLVGIGGSSLGFRAIYETLAERAQAEVYVLESADPYRWELFLKLGKAWHDECHVVVISKSGGTVENISWIEKLALIGGDWFTPKRCTLIASPGDAPLQNWAKKNSIPVLWFPENVGGRFSVMTAVGMFPAALCGMDLSGFREGARWALKQRDLVCQLSDDIFDSWKREEWVTQFWSYSESLNYYGQWLQQLWSESLGKAKDRKGSPAPRASTPMGCIGSRDQHSLLQQVMEGTRDKYIVVAQVEHRFPNDKTFSARAVSGSTLYGLDISLGMALNAQAQAFAKALDDCEIHYSVLKIKNLDERTIGALFMTWEMVIALLGEKLGINAFDQPGVELGKKHLKKLLRG